LGHSYSIKKAFGEKFLNECLGKELIERQVFVLDEKALGSVPKQPYLLIF
jgi:hypothetical protein